MNNDYTLKIEYLPLEALKPYERNAREHGERDLKAIEASIRDFGFNDPIGVWGDNIIVEGHGRLLAAMERGLKTVPVIRLDHLTDEERRGYALAHNRTAELSQWNFDLQAAELADISSFDMTDYGFELESESEAIVEDDYIPEPPEEPKAKLGDIYQLGRHRLMCGDSTDLDSLQRLTGGGVGRLCLYRPSV